jgi:hydroxyacylglutathione hydrolase
MILKHFFEDSLAQSAYLVGCGATKEAIVIDPNLDIQQYLDAAEAEGLRITKVTETHIHADFVSGSRALAQATGATLYVSGEGGPDWQYTFAKEPGVEVVRDGDVIELGRLRFDVVHTPGHTPEHLMFVITDTPASPEPLGAFTGDFLFVGDVGRPDLLETAAGQEGTMESSAKRLFASLQRLSVYSNHLMVWPAHGSGSACGKSMSGVPMSSLGYERISNWALREKDEKAFLASVLADQPDPPMYFGEMKRVNKSGTPAWSAPALPEADAPMVNDLVARRHLAIDVRPDAQRGTLPGAVIVPVGRSFSAWAGSVVSAEDPFFVIGPNRSQAEAAARSLALIGRTAAQGWIPPQALAAWRDAGGQLEVTESTERLLDDALLVDVRTSAEWRAGRLDGATHVPLARLPEKVGTLDPASPVLVYCAAGVRSVVAASALKRLGFSKVISLEGGITAYRERNQRSATVV